MTLGSYNGSINGCRWASEVLRTGLRVAMTREVRGGGGARQGFPKQISMYLICNSAYSRPPSAHKHQPSQHTLQPRNEAAHNQPRPSCTCFRLHSGCCQARKAQPSHLTDISRSWRARRPGATRRPGAKAFSHSTTVPLHFYTLVLGPGSPPARTCPQTR